MDQIVPALDNPRQALTDLNDLAASIRAVGLLTPVIVEDMGDGTYRLVVGHRRHAAAQIAGLAELPALVRSFDPFARKTASLVENGQRVNLTPLEEGAAYQDLLSLDVDGDALAKSVGRSRAEVDGRLAVFALPRSVHKLLADDALTYAEALLLTQVAQHPDDIAAVLERRDQWGWTIGQGVEHVQRARKVTERSEATLAKLAQQKVTVIETPDHGYLDHRGKERKLGTGYGDVGITTRAHRKEPCHAAFIGRDGSPVYVCTDWRRHTPEPAAGGPVAVNAKTERATKRAANKARRDASTERMRAASARALLTAAEETEALGYLLAAVLDHAPREILPAAARLLCLDVPAGQQWEASTAAEAALRTNAARDLDTRLQTALAVHLALAEKDAGAEHPTYRGGPGVLAYTDFLVANGYTETAGDAANRDRYRARTIADEAPADDEDESLSDDEGAAE